jgi:hypothetical protein
MRVLVLMALSGVMFVGYLLVQETRGLADDVGARSTEHAVTAGAPRLLNGASVPVRDGIAGFQVTCDSETGCSGTVTIKLDHQPGGTGTAPYEIAPKGDRWFGVPLSPGTRSKQGTLTWREASGATATADFTLKSL